jgi:hypothetical protein
MKESYAEHLRHQHDNDGGLSATLAVDHEKIAAELRNLPEPLMPAVHGQYLFAMTGTAEERHAAVDAWAARHHVTAKWELGVGYCARAPLGRSEMAALALPVVTGYAPEASEPELAVSA